MAVGSLTPKAKADHLILDGHEIDYGADMTVHG